MADPRRQALAGFIVGAVGIVAAIGMGVAYAVDSGDGGGAYQATAAGFIEEPSGEIGPDAFTPPVDTDDSQICDNNKLVEELQNRPEALQAWAEVLGLPEESVPDYVQTLQPQVLDTDTMVTNHGLHDGVAYARPSVLEAGTKVFMANLPPQEVDGEQPPADSQPPVDSQPTVETTQTTIVTETTQTTGPGTTTVAPGTPVTRCKCGNPLLPPYASSTPGETTTTTTTTITEPSTQPTEPSTEATEPETESSEPSPPSMEVTPPDSEVTPPDSEVTPPDSESPPPDTPSDSEPNNGGSIL